MQNKKVIFGILTLGATFLLAGGYFAYVRWQKASNRIVIENVGGSQAEIAEGQPVATEQEAEIGSGQPAAENLQAIGEADIREADLEKKTAPATEKKTAVPQEQASNRALTDFRIKDALVSWGFQKASSRTIRAIIVHTSYNALGGDPFDFDKVLQEWKDAGVAPHYAIDRKGTVYRLVADGNIAWHAGVSKLPDGTTDVNGASLGVEVVNTLDGKFTDAQYAALNGLLGELKGDYPIKYVLGHDDIAPGRKTDPWGIDWKKVNK